MEPIFEAVLNDERTAAKLLKESSELSRLRMKEDFLVESIPHWLYIGDTPLHLAAAGLRTAAAKLLLKNGADVNAENRRGAMPLHYSCDPRPNTVTAWNPKAQAEMIELLIQNGARPNCPDRSGVAPIHRAVRSRSPVAVGQLLKSGARADLAVAKKGSTPLHLAVQSTGAGGTAGTVQEQIEIIEMLLERGANPNAKDARGRTVLDWTTNQELLEILQKQKRKSSASKSAK